MIGLKEFNLDFNQYQNFTEATAIYKKETAFEYLSLGLLSEAGEVAGKFKKLIRDYPKAWEDYDFTDEQIKDIGKELGDVLWYIARIADELDISLEEIAADNIDKLFSRKERGVLGGSGDNR